eukprot:3619180-Lingulodinium_polyedra.AAC.1
MAGLRRTSAATGRSRRRMGSRASLCDNNTNASGEADGAVAREAGCRVEDGRDEGNCEENG